ncbi:MAG: HAD family phosphatase [Rikenellaceae bacterium]|nr:HAD family phosphatase [Rikenellaceae bacterium]MCL2691945.1 HAD family phosphatase [Rikenellaceae bacterium]
MIKAVIFDMDGVIVDNRDAHVEAFRLLAERHRVRMPDGSLDWMYGRGNDTIIPQLFPASMVAEIGTACLGREKEAIYRDIYADRIRPVHGLVTLLCELRRHGVLCAVGSSAPKVNVDYVLEKCTLEDYFHAVVTGDMVERRKPAPDIFLLAAELLGALPQECLVFEDSESGLRAAHTACMHSAALSTTLSAARLAEFYNGPVIPDFSHVDYEWVMATGTGGC